MVKIINLFMIIATTTKKKITFALSSLFKHKIINTIKIVMMMMRRIIMMMMIVVRLKK